MSFVGPAEHYVTLLLSSGTGLFSEGLPGVSANLFQRLGVLLVKGNAALLLNRIPSFPLPPVDGDL